ncbi:MAG: type III secretion system chaperone [Deltaproteobacteria bacterium]|jgi:hypothetical protein|nr:type III secretion system chaperone [Deltaproteobacteria bacterium]
MTAKRVSELLANPLGISDFKLTPDEPLTILIRSLEINLVYVSELGCLWSEIPLGALPPKGNANRDLLIREMLEANFNRQGSDGGVFSMDPLGLVFLERQWFLPSPREELIPDELGRSVLISEKWAERLAKDNQVTQTTDNQSYLKV